MGKEKIKDLSKHVTGHTCSECSTIYCEYSPELAQEIIDSLDDLMGSIVGVGKSLVRRIEQKYTEDDMTSFARNLCYKTIGLLHPRKEVIDWLKQWEKQK